MEIIIKYKCLVCKIHDIWSLIWYWCNDVFNLIVLLHTKQTGNGRTFDICHTDRYWASVINYMMKLLTNLSSVAGVIVYQIISCNMVPILSCPVGKVVASLIPHVRKPLIHKRRQSKRKHPLSLFLSHSSRWMHSLISTCSDANSHKTVKYVEGRTRGMEPSGAGAYF